VLETSTSEGDAELATHAPMCTAIPATLSPTVSHSPVCSPARMSNPGGRKAWTVRELALFNLGIDSKLRGCDLVGLKVRDICHGDQVASRAVVMQHKTQRPVQFEITPATRDAVQKWIKQAELKSDDFGFPSRIHDSPHMGTRQYARILEHWVEELGLDPADYGTHSMRRTKATLILSTDEKPARRATAAWPPQT
jgi:integrase